MAHLARGHHLKYLAASVATNNKYGTLLAAYKRGKLSKSPAASNAEISIERHLRHLLLSASREAFFQVAIIDMTDESWRRGRK